MQIVPKNCAKRRFLEYPVLEQFQIRIAGLTPQSFSGYWTGAGEIKPRREAFVPTPRVPETKGTSLP
jgi:hypothetical protein